MLLLWHMWRRIITSGKKLVKTLRKRKGPISPCISCLLHPLLCFPEYYEVIDLYSRIYFQALILVLNTGLDYHYQSLLTDDHLNSFEWKAIFLCYLKNDIKILSGNEENGNGKYEITSHHQHARTDAEWMIETERK